MADAERMRAFAEASIAESAALAPTFDRGVECVLSLPVTVRSANLEDDHSVVTDTLAQALSRVSGLTGSRNDALRSYWTAKTADAERTAYSRLLELGIADGYAPDERRARG